MSLGSRLVGELAPQWGSGNWTCPGCGRKLDEKPDEECPFCGANTAEDNHDFTDN